MICNNPIVTHSEVPFRPVDVPLRDELIQSHHEDHGVERLVQQAVQVDVAGGVVGGGDNQADAGKHNAISFVVVVPHTVLISPSPTCYGSPSTATCSLRWTPRSG